MREDVEPGMINDWHIGAAMADVETAIKAYIYACAPYDIRAAQIERDLITFIERNVQDMVDQARER